MKKFLAVALCMGFQTYAFASEAPVPAESESRKTEVYLQHGFQTTGGGVAYRLGDGAFLFGHAITASPDLSGTSRYAVGVHQLFNKVLYARAGLGYAEVEEYDRKNLDAGAGVEFAIGSEWRFKNRFVIGGEWFSTGYFLKDNYKNIGQWIEAPQLRVGVSF